MLAQLRVQFYEFLRRRSFWFSTSSSSVRFDHSLIPLLVHWCQVLELLSRVLTIDSASSPLRPSAGASL